MTHPYGSPRPADPWTSTPPPAGSAPAQPHAWPSSPPGQWTGSAAPAPPPATNRWAVVALVTGLLGLVPVAVPAGVVGLVQTSGRRQAGRGLAVAGLVAAVLWTVVAVVVVVFVFTSADPRAGSPADVGAATVGQCLDAPADGAGRWTPASCNAVHDGEVYLVEQLDSGAWPGEDDLASRADDACHAGFDDYVGQSWFDSAYDYAWFTPDADDWADGERRLVCAVVPYEDDVLRSPARGSGD